MKKLLITSMFAAAVAFAGPATQYFQGFGIGTGPNNDPAPFAADPMGSSFLLMDVLLDTNDVITTKAIDLIKIPYLYRDSAQATTAGYSPVYHGGSVTLSCYDYSDSAAVNDTVDVKAVIQKSQYAGDNYNPSRINVGSGKNDTWTAWDSLFINNASANQAVLDTGKVITLTNERDRYLRVVLTNNQSVIKDRARCRAYWTRKPVLR